MPIYEYQCNECGEEFETFVLSPFRAEEVECPRCHSQNVRRKISLFGFTGSKGNTSTARSSCSTSTVG